MDATTSDLKGKSVLITGASTGIGAAAARAFAKAGCRVAIHYNASVNRAEEVAADVRCRRRGVPRRRRFRRRHGARKSSLRLPDISAVSTS